MLRLLEDAELILLTMTANENEEVKMTVNANTRNVHTLESDEEYTARRGVADETNFFNFTSADAFRENHFSFLMEA